MAGIRMVVFYGTGPLGPEIGLRFVRKKDLRGKKDPRQEKTDVIFLGE